MHCRTITQLVHFNLGSALPYLFCPHLDEDDLRHGDALVLLDLAPEVQVVQHVVARKHLRRDVQA